MNIPGIRLEIEDEVEAEQATYKVKDLVAYLQTLDQNTDVIWAGQYRRKLIFTLPHHGHTLYISESTN